jgi:hypothetical protein
MGAEMLSWLADWVVAGHPTSEVEVLPYQTELQLLVAVVVLQTVGLVTGVLGEVLMAQMELVVPGQLILDMGQHSLLVVRRQQLVVALPLVV